MKNATQSVVLFAFEKIKGFQQKEWYDSITAGQAISKINQRPNVWQTGHADTEMSRDQETWLLALLSVAITNKAKQLGLTTWVDHCSDLHVHIEFLERWSSLFWSNADTSYLNITQSNLSLTHR